MLEFYQNNFQNNLINNNIFNGEQNIKLIEFDNDRTGNLFYLFVNL